MRLPLSQQEVAQKLYGIYKTIETVTGKVPAIDKAGIVETSVSVTEEDKQLFM